MTTETTASATEGRAPIASRWTPSTLRTGPSREDRGIFFGHPHVKITQRHLHPNKH